MPFLRDMLMNENQLPILLLERLVAIGSDGKKGKDYVVRLVLKFCSSNGFNVSHERGRIAHSRWLAHPRHFYRKCLLKEVNPKKAPKHHGGRHLQRDGGGEEIIRSASNLDEAVTRFKKVKHGSLRDISFKNGVLKLLVVVVDGTTDTIFLNLIAFELHVGAGSDVTSYIFFTVNIIDSNRDIALLHLRGIIPSTIGSGKAVVKLFNSLSKDITLDPDSKKPWNV